MSAHGKEKGENNWTVLSYTAKQMIRQGNKLVKVLALPQRVSS